MYFYSNLLWLTHPSYKTLFDADGNLLFINNLPLRHVKMMFKTKICHQKFHICQKSPKSFTILPHLSKYANNWTPAALIQQVNTS